MLMQPNTARPRPRGKRPTFRVTPVEGSFCGERSVKIRVSTQAQRSPGAAAISLMLPLSLAEQLRDALDAALARAGEGGAP